MNEKLIYDLNAEMKEALIEMDFKFFLEKNIAKNNYGQANIDLMLNGKKKEDKRGAIDLKKNKKQELLYLEGNVAKMVRGGILPSLFNMNETRELNIIRFEDFGENWSMFDTWQKYKRRKILRKRYWDMIVKSGALLAIVLSAIKLLEWAKVLHP